MGEKGERREAMSKGQRRGGGECVCPQEMGNAQNLTAEVGNKNLLELFCITSSCIARNAAANNSPFMGNHPT
jgi:hypothetical protein